MNTKLRKAVDDCVSECGDYLKSKIYGDLEDALVRTTFTLRHGRSYRTRNGEFVVPVEKLGNGFEGLVGTVVHRWDPTGRSIGGCFNHLDLVEEFMPSAESPMLDIKLVKSAADFVLSHGDGPVSLTEFDDRYAPHGPWLREFLSVANGIAYADDMTFTVSRGTRASAERAGLDLFLRAKDLEARCAKAEAEVAQLRKWKAQEMSVKSEWEEVRNAVAEHPAVTLGDSVAKAAAWIIKESSQVYSQAVEGKLLTWHPNKGPVSRIIPENG